MTAAATTPTRQTFAQLVAPGVAIPVVRAFDIAAIDPLEAFAALAADATHAALLETCEAASGHANFSIVAPTATAVLDGDDALQLVQAACADVVADIGVDLPRFVGGAIGMLGHEYVSTLEPRVPRAPREHPCGAPRVAFLLIDTLLAFDHTRGQLRAIHTVRVPDSLEGFDVDAAYDEAIAKLEALAAGLQSMSVPSSLREPLSQGFDADPFDGVDSNVGAAEFERLVRDAQEQVVSGECVQIVVSQRFDRAFDGDPLLAYRAVRAVSPAPYHVLLRLDDVTIVGASPEQLVGVLDERVITHPIAGTRPRGSSEPEDVQLERDLRADPKERAEHMMLVDLGRNDIGRVARFGTIQVPQLCEIERFSHVMHLVSRVEGDLRPGLHPIDALRAAFPAGTLTGAPKVRAMEHIARLERDQRGPYGGVIGYVGHGRTLDMAITIRTAVIAHGVASVQAGAGIVAASVPELEEAETRHKARSVLAALALADQHAGSREAASAGGAT